MSRFLDRHGDGSIPCGLEKLTSAVLLQHLQFKFRLGALRVFGFQGFLFIACFRIYIGFQGSEVRLLKCQGPKVRAHPPGLISQ